MTASHASVAHIIADDAKKRFQNIRARYTRDKQKIKGKKKSEGADDVQDVKKEISELYPYLGWLDAHVLVAKDEGLISDQAYHELRMALP